MLRHLSEPDGPQTMKPWLAPALDYAASWLDFQRSHHDQPGCAVAIADGAEIVLEASFGSADLARDAGEEVAGAQLAIGLRAWF